MRLAILVGKLIIPLTIIFFSIVISHNILIKGEHFSHLASSFLQGKTYFLTQPTESWIDTTPSKGNYYWPAGPFPIIFLIPFVYIFQKFGIFFYQGYIQPVMVAGVFYTVFKIAEKLGYKANDRIFWAFAFCFSTVFMNVALWPAPWGFAQVLTTLLLFLAIYGYLESWPLWIEGLLVGAASASRFATVGAAAFFFLVIFLAKKEFIKTKLKKFVTFMAPVFISAFLVGLYNHVRFGSFWDNGYIGQILTNQNLEKAREYGLFNLIHIPGNLYYFLLSTPLPVFKDGVSHVLTFPYIRANPWGMSILVTSPIFLKLFFLKYRDRLSKYIFLTTITIAIPIFLYYGIGWRQAGYRYSLDFLPFLFWLLMRNYQGKIKTLSLNFKFIIILSALANLQFTLTAFLYP